MGQTEGLSGLDLNVEPVWMQGITGSGVVVGVVDDGKSESETHNFSVFGKVCYQRHHRSHSYVYDIRMRFTLY